jgi:hypothetical protein
VYRLKETIIEGQTNDAGEERKMFWYMDLDWWKAIGPIAQMERMALSKVPAHSSEKQKGEAGWLDTGAGKLAGVRGKGASSPVIASFFLWKIRNKSSVER